MPLLGIGKTITHASDQDRKEKRVSWAWGYFCNNLVYRSPSYWQRQIEGTDFFWKQHIAKEPGWTFNATSVRNPLLLDSFFHRRALHHGVNHLVNRHVDGWRATYISQSETKSDMRVAVGI